MEDWSKIDRIGELLEEVQSKNLELLLQDSLSEKRIHPNYLLNQRISQMTPEEGKQAHKIITELCGLLSEVRVPCNHSNQWFTVTSPKFSLGTKIHRYRPVVRPNETKKKPSRETIGFIFSVADKLWLQTKCSKCSLHNRVLLSEEDIILLRNQGDLFDL